MKKISLYLASFVGLSLALTQKASAVCPICTIAVSAGVGFSRYLGIDDKISGLWIGGLIVSMIMWTEDWLDRKDIHFKGRLFVNIFGYYALIILPLYYSGVIGNPLNTLCVCGVDKLFFGIIAGSSAFWFGATWYDFLKEKNNNRAHFPFQKVAMPILPIIILTIIFYLLAK